MNSNQFTLHHHRMSYALDINLKYEKTIWKWLNCNYDVVHVEVIKIKGVGSMEHSERVSHIASDKKEKKRFRLKMPGAFTILFILTIIAVLATWIVPAGAYSKLSYNAVSYTHLTLPTILRV